MAECNHMPDYAGEMCPGCGDEIDQYGNTENDFNACSFPDCGCDGARLCMAGEASERACSYNGEGMYHSKDPTARMKFAGAFYDGEFNPAIADQSPEGRDATRLDAQHAGAVAKPIAKTSVIKDHS